MKNSFPTSSVSGLDGREDRTLGEVDATPVDGDLGHGEETVAGLQFAQVVDRLRRRAPATGREQRAGAAAPVVEVGLVARGSDDLLDVLRVLVLDQEPLVGRLRSEEHTSELQSLMRISYSVFCLKTTTHEATAQPI